MCKDNIDNILNRLEESDFTIPVKDSKEYNRRLELFKSIRGIKEVTESDIELFEEINRTVFEYNIEKEELETLDRNGYSNEYNHADMVRMLLATVKPEDMDVFTLEELIQSVPSMWRSDDERNFIKTVKKLFMKE